MSWNDRIKEAAYTSPSGTRVILSYGNVSEEFSKNTTAYDFPESNKTLVQDLGHTGRKYKLRLFFFGENYDREATAFSKLIKERGIGKLEHPVYGSIKVIPFGDISRVDDLVTAAGQAVFDIVFYETIDFIYPSANINPLNELNDALNDANDALANKFDSILGLKKSIEQSSFKSAYSKALKVSKNALSSVANVVDDVSQSFNLINDSINNGIDTLISTPLTLAFQTMQLLQAPARIGSALQARLDAYKNLANYIFNSPNTVYKKTINSNVGSNSFHNADLFASSYVSCVALSVVNNNFNTTDEVIKSLQALNDLYDSLIDWQENNYLSLEQVDTGETYQAIQKLVALTSGYLVELSFNLLQERSLILTTNRTMIDLVAELYGSVDDKLDFFISSNKLTGTELIELPIGKKIVYYV